MSGGKRKREGEALDDLLSRPWCYYCGRDFEDGAVLQNHQREVHFRCESCNRRLNTASGLTVHTQQVHKSQVNSIRNALPGRENPGLEIFGMIGIPEDLLQAHRQSIIDGYYKRAADFRAKTGNPLPGTVTQDPNVKGKRSETTEEMKARVAARLAANKAKKEAAAKGAQPVQAPTTAQSDTNGAGKEGDEFISLDSAKTDAIFPAESFPPPNFSMSPYGYPPTFPPPNNNGAGFPSYPMQAFPPNPMPLAMPPQHMMPQQQIMPPQHFSPPPQIPPPQINPSQQVKPSITPPAAISGLPQRPSFNAPNLNKAAFATLHTQGSSPVVAATDISISTKPKVERDLDAAPYKAAVPYNPEGFDVEAGDVLPLIDRQDGSLTNITEAFEKVVSSKPNGYLYWTTVAGSPELATSFEEVKRAAADYVGTEIDLTAEPMETILAT